MGIGPPGGGEGDIFLPGVPAGDQREVARVCVLLDNGVDGGLWDQKLLSQLLLGTGRAVVQGVQQRKGVLLHPQAAGRQIVQAVYLVAADVKAVQKRPAGFHRHPSSDR